MILNSILLFLLGTMIGSFLSVVISRIHTQKKGIFFGRSECPKCSKKLCFGDLVPLLSFLSNKGKCRYCKESIGVWYFLLELFTGLILVVLYLKFPFYDLNSTLIYSYFAVISVFLTGILFYDLKFMEIPEIFTYPCIVIIFLFTVLTNSAGLYDMVIGGAVAGLFFGFQVWLSKEKWMGAGDTQVGILIGMLLGWKFLIMCLLIAYFTGAIISMTLIIGGKVTGKTQIPFAPFLIFATFICIFFGEYLMGLYLQTLL